MKWRRLVGFVAAFLAMSGSMLGSEPEKRLQVRWSELKQVIGGKKVTLRLAEGARVKGRVKRVKESSIVLWVKRSSDYPKGQSEIARETISRIEVRDLNVKRAAKRAKQAALTVGAAVGALVGTVLLYLTLGPDEESGVPAIWGGIALGSTVAALMNLPKRSPKRSKDVTLIEILPDSTGERAPKPADKEQSAGPKQNTSSWEAREPSKALEPLGLDSNRSAFGNQGAGATVSSLFEKANPDRVRRQARRALMRPGSDFTSVHEQELVGIEHDPAKGLQRSLELHELLVLGRVGRAVQRDFE